MLFDLWFGLKNNALNLIDLLWAGYLLMLFQSTIDPVLISKMSTIWCKNLAFAMFQTFFERSYVLGLIC
jgi:hypothetical protein